MKSIRELQAIDPDVKELLRRILWSTEELKNYTRALKHGVVPRAWRNSHHAMKRVQAMLETGVDHSSFAED